MTFLLGNESLKLERGRYRTGGRTVIRVLTKTDEPYAVLTVNLPEEPLNDDELFVKTCKRLGTKVPSIQEAYG